MHTRLIIPVVFVCSLLVACGGGRGSDGGDSPTAPPGPQPPVAPVDPPSIEDVYITGSLQVGGYAIATPLNYQQAQGAAPGVHVYQWEQSADGAAPWTPVSNGNASSLALVSSLEGQWIRCGISPVAQGVSTPGAAVFSPPQGPVGANAPVAPPAWWPTTTNPTAGWGGETQPRCISPVKPGKGPHPVGYDSYIEMLQVENLTSDIADHVERFNNWSPQITQDGENDPANAISLVILHALATAGTITTPTAQDCVNKAEAYIGLFQAAHELWGPNANDWYGPNEDGRAHDSNWPSSRITYGYTSQQVLATLYAHLKDELSPAMRLRAEEHALWWMRENKAWRAEWSNAHSAAGYPEDQRGWQWYWDAATYRVSQQAGIIWLLMEFYDPTNPEWQEFATYYGDLVHNKYLPWFQWLELGGNYVESDDSAMWNSVDYYYLLYKNHLALLLALQVGTGKGGYFDDINAPYHASSHRYLHSSIYRCAPEGISENPAHQIGHGWNISQMRQAKLAAQAANSMKFFLARFNDPKLQSLCETYHPNYLWPYNETAFHEVSPTAAPDMPWWFFRDTSTVSVNWQTLPLHNRSLGPGHSTVRTAWSEDADAAWCSYRVGNTTSHHSDIRPGDFCFYHRGWLLPRTISYMNSYRAAVDFCQRKYHGIHIFDPNDPSNDCPLNYAVNHQLVPMPLPRDGGPKRVLEPYTSDIGQGYTSHGAGSHGNFLFDRYQQALQRQAPESNHDLEQSRQRHRSYGTVGGVSYHTESWDWTPMFTRWPFEFNYTVPQLAGVSSGQYGDRRYQGLSRTTRVVHPNGYVRIVTWLDPGGGSVANPPCIVVYDQVQATDAGFPVELHWHAMQEPLNVSTNHWTFTDDRQVISCNNWTWEPTYRNGSGMGSTYQYDGILHLQFWDGTTGLSATDAADVTTYGGPGHENDVYEDGILAGNQPLDFSLFNGAKHTSGFVPAFTPEPVLPWDPNYGPVSVANWTLAIHPATGSIHKRFLTVMNSDVNGAGVGAYPVTVTEPAGQVRVQIALPGGSRTVVIDTTSFVVDVE